MSSLSILSAFTPHPSVSSSIKRLIDILGSLLGLFCLSLLFIPLSIAITLDSPGPIIFKQTRYGLYGEPFTLYKFRSMVPNAEALKHQIPNQATGFIFKNDRDPRITNIGYFLRRTSLDEFPQFWNVLKGEMSLVGTRPPTQDEVIYYNPYHWQRLNIKPGLTGEWQINGRSQIKDFEQIVELDLHYQQKWNIRYDITIILKTLISLFTQKGAF